ncbi:MAG: glycosyl hydrolase [Fimbriimonadales bacterium]
MVKLANPKASDGAQELYRRLLDLSGKRVLSGQHNYPGSISGHWEETARLAGSEPAVWGQDFGFSADDQDGVQFRSAIVEEAIRQHRRGALVTLMWHAVPPTMEEPVTFKEGVQSKLSDSEWTQLLTPGSALHRRWEAQVDVVAKLLLQLRDAGVPVVWRPYHESNGAWFWWGGRQGAEGSAKLYRMLFAKLTGDYGLDNLVWVYNPNAPRTGVRPYEDMYPGGDVVDVLATDIYGGEFPDSFHDDLVALADGRPVAIGEVGQLPTPEVLERQCRFLWFMLWAGMQTKWNTPETLRAVFGHPRTMNLREWAGG